MIIVWMIKIFTILLQPHDESARLGILFQNSLAASEIMKGRGRHVIFMSFLKKVANSDYFRSQIGRFRKTPIVTATGISDCGHTVRKHDRLFFKKGLFPKKAFLINWHSRADVILRLSQVTHLYDL